VSDETPDEESSPIEALIPGSKNSSPTKKMVWLVLLLVAVGFVAGIWAFLATF